MPKKYSTKVILFLSISMIIHLSILLFSLTNEQKEQKIVKLDKPKSHLIDFETILPSLNEPLNAQALKDKEVGAVAVINLESMKCKDGSWYGGIGVKVVDDTNLYVTAVFKGYAADKAGIEVGDFLTPIDSNQLMGTPGTLVTISILRNGITITKKIQRVKVCYA